MNAENLSLIYALCASGLFGATVMTAKNGLDTVDPQTGALIILTLATSVFWISAPWWLVPANLFTTGFWIFCLNGLLHPMLSMYCTLEATTRTHASVAATLASTAPLFAAVSAVILLGEEITLPIAVGTLVAVAGIALLSWVPQNIRRVMLIAILFSTVTAAVRGITMSTGKFGMNFTFDPPLAGAASFTVSTVGTWLIFRATRGHFPRNLPRAGFKWFAITGIANGIAVFFMYGAIALGTVTIVSPIIAASPVFSIIIGRILFKEKLSTKSLFGIGLVLVDNITNQIARWLLRGYTNFLSPYKGYGCAHRLVEGGQSCSSYYDQTLRTHQFLEATRLLHTRLRDCRSAAESAKHRDGKAIIPCVPFI